MAGSNEKVPMTDIGGFRMAQAGHYNDAVAKTEAYTIKESEIGTLFTNRGASGSVTFTLPAPKKGLFFGFTKAVNNQNLVVTTDVAATKIHGLTQGVTLTNSTSEYGVLQIYCDGTAWFTVSSLGTWTVS